MIQAILASRFDLPFYLRLPSSVFLTWDPEASAAGMLPRQRLGQVSFSRTTHLLPEDRLLDAPGQAPYLPPAHQVLMTCETKDYGEIPTLHIDTGQTGGFAELRPYTEITVFVTLPSESDGQKGQQSARVMSILNHFLDLYRLVTQDPWVISIDPALDLYLVDNALGTVPETLHTAPADAVIQQLNAIPFATAIGDRRQYTYRLNTLEDLFPGKVLDRAHLDLFAGTLPEPYELPLHYELILSAQVELKRRHYHVAILEAETAFEVYLADLLVRLKEILGETRSQVLADMEDPRRLGLLAQRLRALDTAGASYTAGHGLPSWNLFVGSAVHAEWKAALYALRNRVVHAGYRQVTFEEARRGIVAGKAAIKYVEDGLPALGNRIQIYPGGDHLQNTAGRLQF